MDNYLPARVFEALFFFLDGFLEFLLFFEVLPFLVTESFHAVPFEFCLFFELAAGGFFAEALLFVFFGNSASLFVAVASGFFEELEGDVLAASLASRDWSLQDICSSLDSSFRRVRRLWSRGWLGRYRLQLPELLL